MYQQKQHEKMMKLFCTEVHQLLPQCQHRLMVNSAPGAALSALQVLDRLAGGRAGIQSATVLDTSPDMLQLVQQHRLKLS
ncbi:hypothetical protein HaLaN_14683 [Haematococcus lacustris]|uniref:Uncharacterized protein n=1 Tax=Haematococcus lacustris TaxID=44745 RepID=A0A699Z8P4_HAELA|nr:hypothetical protein HaLaN_14683 [Haematococcus lacustris]